MIPGYLSGVNVKYVFCDRPENITVKLQSKLSGCNIRLFEKSSGKLREIILHGDKSVVEKTRENFDRLILEKIRMCGVDYVFLIGYMLVASPVLCDELKMLNLHPDLPGRFTGTWQQVMQQIIEHGVNTAGAMINLVTPELDKGPALSFSSSFKFPIGGINKEKIREEEFRRELPLILLTLKALAAGEIVIRGREVYTHDRKGACDFSQKVENFTL